MVLLFSKQTALLAYESGSRRYVLSFLGELGTAEAGSRTLSRFGVEDEQIYLVIRDHKL
jgi:hypothetical protein